MIMATVKQLTKTVEDMSAAINNLTMQIEDGSATVEENYSATWSNRIDRDFQWVSVHSGAINRVKNITKDIVDAYADQSAFLYTYNPLIKRVVEVKSQFTFARDFTITSKSGKNAAESIYLDPLNQQGFFSHQAITEIDSELQQSGNVFIALWKDSKQVRAWSSYEIADIILDKEDACRPIMYLREWVDEDDQIHRRAYPSIYVQSRDVSLRQGYVSWQGKDYEIDQDISILHVSTNKGIKQKFALSELVAACPWAMAHQKYIEDWGAIVAALRKYTHIVQTNGSSKKAGAIASQLSGNTNYMGTPFQSNPAGSTLVMQEGTDMKVVSAGKGMAVGPEDSRYFLLMVCAATSVPETYLTMDPSTGNLATAKEIGPVFIQMIETRQTLWKNAFNIILKFFTENDDYEVSFPPIRANIDAYVDNVNKFAWGKDNKWTGAVTCRDYVIATYEALEWKLPPEDELDLIVADFEMRMQNSGEGESELSSLTQATKDLEAAVRK